MFLSNFHFLRFDHKGHFKGVEFFLTDGQTDRPTDGPTDIPNYRSSLPELKNAKALLTNDFYVLETQIRL